MKTLPSTRHLAMSAIPSLAGRVRVGLLFALLSTLLTSVAVAQSALPTEYAQYDLDGDGTLAAADAQVIYHYILGTAGESVTLEAVDLNADGEVNTADVVTLYVKVKAYQEYLDSLPEGIEGWGPDSDDSEFGPY